MMQLRLHHQASSDYPRWCRPHPAHRWLALAVGHRRYLWKDSIFENLPARVIWCLAEHLMAVFLSMWFKLPNVVLVSQICRLVRWCLSPQCNTLPIFLTVVDFHSPSPHHRLVVGLDLSPVNTSDTNLPIFFQFSLMNIHSQHFYPPPSLSGCRW